MTLKQNVQGEKNFRWMVASCFALSFFLSACQNDSRPQGQYSGTLYQPVNGVLQAVPVTFDIEYSSKDDGSVSITDLKSKPLSTIQLQIKESNQVEMGSRQLNRSSDEESSGKTCFTDDSTKLCYSGDSFSIETFDGGSNQETFGLFGRLSSQVSAPVLEQPQAYTLNDAMKIALQRNFGSRIEYEHALQARLTAKSAYLQLLPHLSAGSAISVASGGVFGVLAALGDLAPFLFPSRWFQAKEAQKQSQAEQDTLALMHADLMPQVEGLFYTNLQDEGSLSLYRQIIADTTTVYNSVSDLESKGQMPAGSANHLLSTLQSLQMDEQGLEVLVRKDHTAIAQALGFMNPNAVLEVSLPAEESPIEAAQSVQFDGLIGAVLDRSLELRQISDLKQVARLQKDEIPFDWLDPGYDSSRDLGFALGAEVQISNSKIHELELLSQQMEETLEVSLDNAVEDYNLNLSQFSEVTSHFDLQKKRWEIVIAQVFPGTSLNTLDIQSIIGDYLAAGIGIEATRAAFRVARARIDRLLFQNAYAIPQFKGVLL